MTPLRDGEAQGVVDDGAHIVVVGGAFGEGEEAVGAGHCGGNRVEVAETGVDTRYQFVVDAVFYHGDPLLGAVDLLLVFLKFRSDVALGADKRLLAYPVLRHLVLVGVAHLEVVAEHIVEVHL